MYVIFKNKKLIAISDDKDIAISFYQNYQEWHKQDIIAWKKIPRKIIKSKFDNYMDYYLVRYGETYVPEKYIDSLCITEDQYFHDIRMVKEILERTVINESLSPKEISSISKTLVILEDLNKKYKEYVPSLEEMEIQNSLYEEYQYSCINTITVNAIQSIANKISDFATIKSIDVMNKLLDILFKSKNAESVDSVFLTIVSVDPNTDENAQIDMIAWRNQTKAGNDIIDDELENMTEEFVKWYNKERKQEKKKKVDK